MKKIFSNLTKHFTFKNTIALVALLLAGNAAKAQLPGNWNPSPATTTTNAVGIGTTTPIGWQEIRYCDEQQKGLVITNTVCPFLPVKNFPITFDGKAEPVIVVEPGGGGTGSGGTYNYPIMDYTLKPFNNFSNNNPLIWARMENASMFYSVASGTYSSRFIVTPGGTSGVNIEVPRATFDIKSLGAYNYPGLIVGRQAMSITGRTRHAMFVPLLHENGYNKITQFQDQGMFFTDGLGTDGANLNSAFIIAPWANNGDPNVGGLRIDNMGNLDVHGNVKATGMNLAIKWWSDFVFDADYKRMPLAELENFITQNHHLPNVPTECEMIEKGVNVADMQAIHMQKIEELTLYAIEQDKKITEQGEQLKKQQQEIEELKTKLDLLLKK